MPLPCYHGLISPPAESSSQPFVSSCPKGGLVTAIHVNRVGLCCHSARVRVAQPRGRYSLDWVEVMVSHHSARCSLASHG